MTLEEAVEAYASAAGAAFTLQEALDWIGPRLRACPDRFTVAVVRELEESRWLLSDEETDRYVPRRAFFRGARFLVMPAPEEIERGMMIPGHRFYPFISDDVVPSAVRLAPAGAPPMERFAITERIEDVLVFFTLLGPMRMMEYLAFDDPENVFADADENSRIRFSVFDMSGFYKRTGFAQGDGLLLTVEDWAEGRFGLEHVPAGTLERMEAERARWCEALETALIEVFDLLGPMTEATEQLAHAFFRAPRWLLESPPLHVGGFLQRSKSIGLQQSGLATTLWHAGRSYERDMLSERDLVPPEPLGRLDSLQGIIEDLGLAVTEEVIEAYMLDELFRGGGSLDAVIGRFLAGRGTVQFYDQRQGNAFWGFLKEKWARLALSYDRARDRICGPLRSQALEIADEQFSWMREADAAALHPEQLSQDDMLELGALSTLLTTVLVNLTFGVKMPREEASNMRHMIDETARRSREVTARLRRCADDRSEPALRIVDGTGLESGTVYRLKVTLRGIRPPIWRRIEVPGTISLDELHHVIQIAMGWTNSHLHAFEIDGEHYGMAGPDGFEDLGVLDETGVPLASFGLREGDKFRYEYDFGDSWEHTIQCEKILSADPAARYPRCVKGKRAAPPEDCGGVPGYESLLEVMADPTHPEHGEMIEWLGYEYAPEAFDLDAVNRRLGAACR